MSTFKQKFSKERRCQEAARINAKYTDRIPIIVEQTADCGLPPLDKKKYLVPNDLTVGQFMYVIRKRFRLPAEKGMFIFIGGSVPAPTSMIASIYKTHKDPDGFLYINVTAENTFG